MNVCNGLLFIHAILGCDTTPQLFGIGIGKGLTKLTNDTSFTEYAEVFNNYAQSLKEEIITAGENAIVAMYMVGRHLIPWMNYVTSVSQPS